MLMVPPDIFITFVGKVEVKPKEGVVAHPPAVQIFTEPADGVKVSVDAFEVPLLIVTPVTDLRLALAEAAAVQELLEAPVKVTATCEVLPLWLKSIVPLLARLPPIESAWVLTAPAGLASKAP